jgi:hypothetical protein
VECLGAELSFPQLNTKVRHATEKIKINLVGFFLVCINNQLMILIKRFLV